MKIIKKVKKILWPQDQSLPLVLTFTGGMGAQIINAAIYFLSVRSGRSVYADFSYFDAPEKVAIAGNRGECSQWSWQLDYFGLPMSAFDQTRNKDVRAKVLQDDDVRKSELSLKALAIPEIAERFHIPSGVQDVLGENYGQYICMHIRRGDFVNVASHLVGDDEFLAITRKFSGLVNEIVLLSDSPISEAFKKSISNFFERVHILDDIDAYSAHRIMRNARILICSNSQFSLTAALLNPSALVMVPIQWFGGGQRVLEAPLNSACSFQIMTRLNID